MTRVNLVPVEELMDQHLVAEYRELTMVPASLNRSIHSKAGFDVNRIGSTYRLGSGHVYFFYNKGKFLNDRYSMLVKEMHRRGMNPDPNRKFPAQVFIDNDLYGDFIPNEYEISLSRERLQEKISQKPEWYRYMGKPSV